MTARVLLAILCVLATASRLGAQTMTTLEAPGPNGPLRGTFLAGSSDRTWAPVLIIPGSGPTDRDGNNPLGVRAATYRLLAEGLATAGIPTLRVDKRGLFGSADAIPDPDAVTLRDYAADVHAWSAVLRERTGAPCVWLLGHSEGGLVALVSAQSEAKICGLILIATPGRPLGEVLREQLRANPANAPLLDQAEQAIDRLEAGQRVDGPLHPALAPLFRPQVQDFMIDAFSYNPAALVAAVSRPILILQGARDLQVSVADAQRLKAAKPDAALLIVPDANHVLKSVVGDDAAANIATYGAVDLPLAADIVPAITAFMRKHTPLP
jgi:pimeloyl-ACP methyl ester carboxylesterase